jgi:hypothetical protein
MVADSNSSKVAELPADLVSAVEADVLCDAQTVITFLNLIGINATPQNPFPLPRNFLLYLGVAMRLTRWECAGFTLHRDAGLPSATQVLQDAFRSLQDPDADPTELSNAVRRFGAERFVWCSRSELGVDMTLSEAQEEELLEALADFLWSHRLK